MSFIVFSENEPKRKSQQSCRSFSFNHLTDMRGLINALESERTSPWTFKDDSRVPRKHVSIHFLLTPLSIKATVTFSNPRKHPGVSQRGAKKELHPLPTQCEAMVFTHSHTHVWTEPRHHRANWFADAKMCSVSVLAGAQRRASDTRGRKQPCPSSKSPLPRLLQLQRGTRIPTSRSNGAVSN